MAWICPECGHANKDKFYMCVCGYENGFGTDAEGRRHLYMHRIYPTNRLETFFVVIFSLIAISILAAIFFSKNVSSGVIIGLVFTYVAGLLLANTIIRRFVIRDFGKKGTQTLATVVYRYVEGDRDSYGGSSCTYNIVVRFFAVEKEWTLKAIISQELYEKAGKDKLSIIYDDSEPRCALLEGEY
jgi:hypothetical protein